MAIKWHKTATQSIHEAALNSWLFAKATFRHENYTLQRLFDLKKENQQSLVSDRKNG